MNEFEKSIYTLVCQEMGIVPLVLDGDDAAPGLMAARLTKIYMVDADRALRNASPDEARAMKRKFRKLWRKAMKKVHATGKALGAVPTTVAGVKGKPPTRSQRQERKRRVLRDIVGPKVQEVLASLRKHDDATLGSK